MVVGSDGGYSIILLVEDVVHVHGFLDFEEVPVEVLLGMRGRFKNDVDILMVWFLVKHPHDVFPEFVLELENGEVGVHLVDEGLLHESNKILSLLEGSQLQSK